MSTLLYNPDRKSKGQLISEFVVRTQVYDEILHDLETSKMEFPEQHYLLVGQRGAGKTTLLNRLKYGIQDAEKLKNKLIPVIFNEEQYNISELSNLWESIAQFLEDYQGFDGVYSEIEKHIDKRNFEELSYDILEKYLHKYDKRLVLLIDNIGDLLKKLDKNEVRRLREILQTKKEIRLIAGSPFYLETILDYHQPLFEFFKVIRLDGLNEQETQNLLLKLGELSNEKEKIEKIINETPERIETLRTLTGGVPRTIALMYRIFTDYNDESTVKDLERILDAVTPLYKHRMDDLPIQQQKIVDAVAKNWDAISVKELREKVRIDSKNISAQLRQLEKNQVIEKKETGKKNHLYFVKERFFNIWYLMRYGRRDDKQKVVWLVRFLESWCSSTDLKSRIIDYIEKIKSGSLDTSAIHFYGKVYTAISNLDVEVKLLLKEKTPTDISDNVIISDKELYPLLARYRKEEKWEALLNLVLSIDSLSFEVKSAIGLAVMHLYAQNSKTEIFEDIFRKIEASNKTEEGEYLVEFTEVEAEIFKNILLTRVFGSLFKGEAEYRKGLDLYFSFLAIKDFGDKSFERHMVTQLLCLLLAGRNYNIVSDIFREVKHLDLVEIFKPIHYANIYLQHGKNSDEFLKAAPEIMKSINEVLERIEFYNQKLKSRQKNASN